MESNFIRILLNQKL